jgi:hypothetical protein
VKETAEHLESRRTAAEPEPDPDVGFDPPSVTEFKAIPWAGPGPDPLEEMWEAS